MDAVRWVSVVPLDGTRANGDVFELLKLNARQCGNVEPHMIGLGDVAGSFVLKEVKGNMMASWIDKISSETDRKTYQIEVKRLDDLKISRKYDWAGPPFCRGLAPRDCRVARATGDVLQCRPSFGGTAFISHLLYPLPFATDLSRRCYSRCFCQLSAV